MEVRIAEAAQTLLPEMEGRPLRVYLFRDQLLIARDPAPPCEADGPYTWDPEWGLFEEPSQLGPKMADLLAAVEAITGRRVLERFADRSAPGPFDLLVLGPRPAAGGE